ncbi:MAG TPA: hypothetical protein VKR06_22455 [Ktedonosporobacter sp.]|nr:hypothetical protein [Ktedonosporobacter sp.]
MADSTPDPLHVGEIRFYDNAVPELKAGTYTIKVTQEVNGIDFGKIAPPLPQTQKLVVRGPQFHLDPQEIHAMYPPANSTGQFAEVLPHIVLNRRVLPWERQIGGSNSNIPWLALLVFAEGEMIGGDPIFHVSNTTVEVFLAQDQPVLTPALMKEEDISKTDSCQYIQLATATFQQITPRLEEAKYLAHCREINTRDKSSQGTGDAGWFAVVVCNRFPVMDANTPWGTRNIAHLVSLEGLERYLKDTPVFTRSGEEDGTPHYEKINLLSLANWTFTCQEDNHQDFQELMQHLVTNKTDETDKVNIQPVPPATLWLSLRTCYTPPPDASGDEATEVENRLTNGYVPLEYHTRTGEETFAWYRGPLTPILPQELVKTDPFLTADSAIMYHPVHGLFDHSLSAAWQIGQLLAIADQSFAGMLLKFRRRTTRLIDQALERLSSEHLDTSEDLQQVLAAQPFRKRFLEILGRDLLITIGQQPVGNPDAPQAPPPIVPRRNPVQVLTEFLSRDDVAALVQTEVKDDLVPIVLWLTRLYVLYGIPFHYLVPDVRMLPEESIRFFYLDENWIKAMLDGALSIGIQTRRDTIQYKLSKDMITEAVRGSAHTLRPTLERTQSGDIVEWHHAAGFLLRSAIVSSWPGLAVRGYDKEHKLLPILRLDHLAPSVLFCLSAGIPARIELSEPQESLRFGTDGQGAVQLRTILSGGDQPLGTSLDKLSIRGSGDKAGYLRSSSRVLSLLSPNAESSLVTALTKQLNPQHQEHDPLIGPAEFAMQMVKSPEQQTFYTA